jgi:hypothetical protein
MNGIDMIGIGGGEEGNRFVNEGLGDESLSYGRI